MIAITRPDARRPSGNAFRSKSELPMRVPDVRCNARMSRSRGYCQNTAGQGTEHPGIGRCRLHGGDAQFRDAGQDSPLALMRRAGLTTLIDLAETMTSDDAEYLMHVGTAGLVVARAQLVSRLANGEGGVLVSSKEAADLTMAISRIDVLLSKHADEEDPDAESNVAADADAVELARLLTLEHQSR